MTRARITEEVLDVQAHAEAVAHPAAGAVITFAGVVRDHDAQRSVVALEYEAHPSAEAILTALSAEFAARPEVRSIAVSHRIGALKVGETALVAAVATPHRAEGFAICAELIDQLKARLPIWKRQLFADGTDEWVACP